MAEQPMTPWDDDLALVVEMALRYQIGRSRSGGLGVVHGVIERRLPLFGVWRLKLMSRIIAERDDLGDDIDRREWLEVRELIERELSRRRKGTSDDHAG